ncbi:MAG: sodium:solute symporter family protein [Acidobacteria bacterium]|nr:sodium:solute symporter family protein [Acidobacteriota bacterium]
MIVILVYVALQLGIGYWVSKRVATEADYLVAGRSLGFGLTMFSVFATWFGAETCIGSAAEARDSGMSGVISDPFGYAICMFLFGLLLAAPLWRKKLITLADLYRSRFAPGVERLAALLMIPTSVLWAAAQVRAFGIVLTSSSSVEIEVAISIAAAIVVLYSMMGGVLADAFTDVIQGSVLIVGLVILGVAVFMQPTAGTHLAEFGAAFFASDTPPSWLMRMETWAIPIVGSLVAQELVVRAVSARSEGVARKATLIASGIYFVVGLIPVLIGIVSLGLMPELPNGEQVLPAMAHQYLPRVLAVVFVGALVSAILSTVDSALLVAGALLSHNLVTPMLRHPDEKTKLLMARLAVALFGVLAYVLALYADTVYGLVEEASAFGSSGIVVVTLMGLFSRYGSALNAYAALFAGLSVYVVADWQGLETPFVLSLVSAWVAYLLPGRGRKRMESEETGV